ncbi:MAG: DNA polymerase III subunit chi [Rhodobacteraceae bacterium]|nr:DNA polymerase III subunit chi [Paracoccaceae bacterium]MAY46514.1 DNA polymerase III subunit chi [Paracoccaceae bacterium]
MGDVYFYHLTRRPLDAVLPMLLDRALQAGWRIAVRGTDARRMSWLDEKLWQGPEEHFLPHGLAGGPHDALQPVLLTADRQDLAGFACAMSVDGADIAPDEVAQLQRACILFDGLDGQAVQHARGQWKALTVAGCKAQYWSEESGRWEKKAEA